MKLVGVENNIVNVGYGSNWLITSDKPINQNGYYFEVEFKSSSVQYSTGYIGYTYKYQSGFKYIIDIDNTRRKLYYPSFVVLARTYENDFSLAYINTKQNEFNKSVNIDPSMFLSSRVGIGIKSNSNKSVNFDIYKWNIKRSNDKKEF